MHDANASILANFLGKCIFSLQLPNDPAIGDEIIVKATLKEDAKRLSIILGLARSEGNHPQAEPDLIAYSFGLMFDNQECRVIQNHKNIDWYDEPLIGPDEGFNRDSVNLIFRFEAETIKVFIDDTQHAADYEYEHRFPIEQIKLIELWDDIERVQEITLRFS